MIYFTNVDPQLPHLTFIGRWSPFHEGHLAIIQKKRKKFPKLPILVMVRDSTTEQFSASIRAEYIKHWIIEQDIRGTIMIIPNVFGVYWGRNVGYETEYVNIPKKLQLISGTHIRNYINTKKPAWKNNLAQKKNGYLLTPKISHIIERGLVVWLTGCPASGKTTIAKTLIKKAEQLFPHLKTQLLDGDTMRSTPMADTVGFSTDDRAKHVLRMAYLAKMFADQGILVICAFVSPDRSIRKKSKRIIGGKRFVEVYVNTSLAIRMKRDVKELYKKAQAGKILNLTGFNGRYQPPIKPDVICDNDRNSATYHANRILTKITQ